MAELERSLIAERVRGGPSERPIKGSTPRATAQRLAYSISLTNDAV
jgi:hypothetical protein